MRLHGYCSECHRVRVVRVSGAGLASAGRGVPTGVCGECQEKADGPFIVVARQRGRVTILPRHRSLQAAAAMAARLADRGHIEGELSIEEHARHYPFGLLRRYDVEGKPVRG